MAQSQNPLLVIEDMFTLAFLLPFNGLRLLKDKYDGSERAQRNETKKALTPPKVQRRERALTIPRDNPSSLDLNTTIHQPQVFPTSRNNKKEQISKSQPQSPLFASLPLEIRTLIWEQAILLHTQDADSATPTGTIQLSLHFASTQLGRSPLTIRPSLYHPNPSIIPLLQTCRSIYTEAIPLVYSIPTFVFTDFDAFLAFSATLLPQRLNSIRNLDLRFFKPVRSASERRTVKGLLEMQSYEEIRSITARSSLPHPKVEDKTSGLGIVCAVLRDMKGLRRLGFRLGKGAFAGREVDTGQLLWILDTVGWEKGRGGFGVWLDWWRDEEVEGEGRRRFGKGAMRGEWGFEVFGGKGRLFVGEEVRE